MNYKSYQHIEKIGKSEVEGLLNGTCYISYKIDGTNGCVFLGDDKELHFGSRNREISLKKDNSNFYKLMTSEEYKDTYNDLKKLLINHPDVIIYGEWLVPVTIKRYKQEATKKFYVFDIYDTNTDTYLNYDTYSALLKSNYPNIDYIPLLAKITNPTIEQLKELLNRTGEFLITQGLGEGIVVKNYEFRNTYGRTTWGKMLTEDFLKEKNTTRNNNHQNNHNDSTVEYEIAKLLTNEHISKELNKLLENKQVSRWEMTYMSELMNRVFIEFYRDNWEIILKKFHNPTINFKTLKSICDNKTREFVLSQNY